MFLGKSLHFGPEFPKCKGGMRPSLNPLSALTTYETQTTVATRLAGQSGVGGVFPRF